MKNQVENANFCKKTLRSLIAGLDGESTAFASVDESMIPLFLLAFAERAKCGVYLEVPGYALAEKTANAASAWSSVLGCSKKIAFLPDGVSCGKNLSESEIPRSAVLDSVLHDPPDILIASSAAMLSPAPKPETMDSVRFILKKGMALSMNTLAGRLVEMDYDDESEVVNPGEFSRRGGIVDLFSPAEKAPVRIEFWGDEIDSLRLFSPATQLSTGTVGEYSVVLRSGSALSGRFPGEEPPEELPEDAGDFSDFLAVWKPFCVSAYPRRSEKTLERFFPGAPLEKWKKLYSSGMLRRAVLLLDDAEAAEYPHAASAPFFPLSRHILNMIPEGAEENVSELVRQLNANLIKQLLDESYAVCAAGGTEKDAGAIREWLSEALPEDGKKISCFSMRTPCGIFAPERKFALFTEHELFASVRRLTSAKPLPSRESDRFRDLVGEPGDETFGADLEDGDFAVHINYGICVYHGLHTITDKDSTYEALELEFDDDTTVHVPVSQAHCVSRYIGSTKGGVRLSRIGSSRWAKTKLDAASSVRTLALDMLKLHASRCASEGAAFPGDDFQQQLFEKAFPFTETPDQLRAADEIKRDMEEPRPMDRLLCGDVGYGKTEVAMRAVFKCVMAGRQAAILVPTTVLAQQHYYNFLERFAGYPVLVDTLSRFKTKAGQNDVVKRLAEGKLDVVIGTHRLLQGDVKFKGLGLVVVDEEQRFGVLHKEKLKNLRATVDVLTMTATPIPRTLYFSMSGMRDLSTIMSAPVRRLPVQTIVSQDDDAVVASAISRELQRNGQVYFLYNRVKTIDKAADRIRALVPKARVGIGHGQMDEHGLEDVMSRFIEGKLDVLVCTTIIESGIDVPNANTIIIDRADRLGLAELYQLRGRVGRWNRQAFAFLLLPKSAVLAGNARERIAAIRKYTHLGAGFKLALRDLEIRGAGNILGAEQSGHIAAVGFTLYCQLLRAVTLRMKGIDVSGKHECRLFMDFVDYSIKTSKNKVPAAFPESYIDSDRLRLDAYRRLALANEPDALEKLRAELADRFGKLPREAENLFLCAEIRILGVSRGLDSISCSNGRVVIQKGSVIVKPRGRIPELPSALDPETRLRFLKLILERDLPETVSRASGSS